jgi:frataxin-like iron-binding protein CyaY
MSPIDYLIGKVVLADLGAYQASGRLLSCRDDEMTLQTRSGSRIVVNRQETRSIRELVARGRQA